MHTIAQNRPHTTMMASATTKTDIPAIESKFLAAGFRPESREILAGCAGLRRLVKDEESVTAAWTGLVCGEAGRIRSDFANVELSGSLRESGLRFPASDWALSFPFLA